jgi:hypothetical protein
MTQAVTIVFDCLPFRQVGHMGLPLDASDEQRALWRRFRAALAKHGTENTYFLYNADCTFRLSNSHDGWLRFLFEATVRTDTADSRPEEIDLAVRLAETDFPTPIADDALAFFREAVRRAVLAEFQLFIDEGNLRRAMAQQEQVLREWDRTRGFIGIDI